MKSPSLTCRAAGLATVLAFAAAAGWSAPPPKPAATPQSGIIAYEVQITGGKQPVRKTEQKTWFKGSKLRREIGTPQGTMIQLMGPDGTYMLLPGQKQAIKAPGNAAQSPGPEMLFREVPMIKQQGKKVGSEKVGRYQTDIYEQSGGKGTPPGAPKGKQPTVRVWISSSAPVPIKVVNKLPQGQTITMVLKTLDLNAAIPDSMFQLPKGIKVSTAGPPGTMPPGRPGPR